MIGTFIFLMKVRVFYFYYCHPWYFKTELFYRKFSPNIHLFGRVGGYSTIAKMHRPFSHYRYIHVLWPSSITRLLLRLEKTRTVDDDAMAMLFFTPAPHHSTTMAVLVGGGFFLSSGEILLAHNGAEIVGTHLASFIKSSPARTLADMAGEAKINRIHLAEALSYRCIDRLLHEL